ncbi:MAG: tetratricopeptide repeat protein [Rhodobacteraceae bacterium]|nr:tetratricopeptide repeat protein [Paracoccaceae bacterium]
MFKPSINVSVAFWAAVALSSLPAHAQTDSIESCLRYVQSYERALKIPGGLLMSIAFTESGHETERGDRVPWPWTVNSGGRGEYFETKAEAVAAVRQRLDEGERSIDVGCMQINLRYHPNAFRDIETAFDPAANVAYGAQYLRSLYQLQGSWAKAVERYHSSDDGRREEYRERVLAFWNDDARKMILSAVEAENTDTPYHRAVRDYAAGRYADALDKYQGLVDRNPNDRLALLGVAMSYEQLGRTQEAFQTYVRTLQVEPENEVALTRLIQIASSQPAPQARTWLENAVNTGVDRPAVLAALSEFATASGDDNAALKYIGAAIAQAPQVPMYQLNAGVLADRLRRTSAAVAYYGEFLRAFTLDPLLIDIPVENVRARFNYLRAQL